MKPLWKAGTVAAVVGLSACAGQPVDNSPAHSTSVITAKYVLNGLYAPDFTGEQTVYTRADRRRLDHKTTFDSFLMRWANLNTSDIARLDRSLMWMLDHDQETYRECPIAGCIITPLWETAESQEEVEEYESYDELGCKVELATNTFNVTPTGNQRDFSGINASEYKVEWKTEFKDAIGKTDANLLQFVFWTATPNTEMNKAWQVNREFQQAYLGQAANNPFMRLLGKEGYMAIAAFSGDIEKTDTEQYNSITRELAKIEGYPLSIKFEWFQKSEACQEQRNPARNQTVDMSNGLEGAALSMVGGFLNQQKDKVLAEWNKDARVRYIYEVTSVKEEMIKDSQFELAHGYTMSDRQ